MNPNEIYNVFINAINDGELELAEHLYYEYCEAVTRLSDRVVQMACKLGKAIADQEQPLKVKRFSLYEKAKCGRSIVTIIEVLHDPSYDYRVLSWDDVKSFANDEELEKLEL